MNPEPPQPPPAAAPPLPSWRVPVAAGIGAAAVAFGLLLVGIPGGIAARRAWQNAPVLAEFSPSGPTPALLDLFVEASDEARRDPDRHLDAAIALEAGGRADEAVEHLWRAFEGYQGIYTAYPSLFSDVRRARIAEAARRLGASLVAGDDAATGVSLLAYAQDVGVRPVPCPEGLGGVALVRARPLADAPSELPQPFSPLVGAFDADPAATPAQAAALMESQGWTRILTDEAVSAPESRRRTPDDFVLYGRDDTLVFRVTRQTAVEPGTMVLLAAGTRSAGVGPLVEVTTSHGAKDLVYLHDLEFRPVPLAIGLPAGTTEITLRYLNDANETAFLTEAERAGADRRTTDRNAFVANLWAPGEVQP